MRIVLGLGNPGPKYRWTRHNVGFMVADALAERHGASFSAPGGALGDLAWIAETRLGDVPVRLAKPTTFMNLSGRAALELCRRFRVGPERLVVAFDDADLAFGRVRVRAEGSAGGHNGVRSILEVLGTREFPRVKLGVRGVTRAESDLADYVLRPFLPDERPEVAAVVSRGADAVECLVTEGIDAAMRRFNGP